MRLSEEEIWGERYTGELWLTGVKAYRSDLPPTDDGSCVRTYHDVMLDGRAVLCEEFTEEAEARRYAARLDRPMAERVLEGFREEKGLPPEWDSAVSFVMPEAYVGGEVVWEGCWRKVNDVRVGPRRPRRGPAATP